MSRLDKMLKMLDASPTDAFLLYGIALEYKKLNEFDKVISYLDRTIQSDPNYCYAYYQKGQTLELMNDLEQARRAYRDGIKVAQSVGDSKAIGELTGALEMIS